MEVLNQNFINNNKKTTLLEEKDYWTKAQIKELIAEKLNTKIRRIEVLSLYMDAITASRKLEKDEESFQRKFCSLLGLKVLQTSM